MLQIRNFSKTYKDKPAVDNLSLHIKKGELYAFIGHNGAGKTTTLKACAGILDFEAGEILVGGVNVKNDPVGAKKLLAYIPDNPDLYEFMTGIKYLNFVADVFRLEKGVRDMQIKKYADMFELTKSLGGQISTYSHGMKQKLALISALIHSPKLMMLDEPFVGLDPKAAHLLKQTMRQMCSEGSAIFFSTHVLDVAEKLCDKVAIIKNGKLIAAGEMDKIKGDSSLEDVFLEIADHNDGNGQNYGL